MLMRFGISMILSVLWLIPIKADELPPAPQSPRLANLLAAVNRHDQTALEEFWKDIKKARTPLVEDIPNQPHEALYTFLVRADPQDDVINMRLGADFPMHTQYHTDSFGRLGATNVWYTSYVLPKTARGTYRIRVPKGLEPSPQSKVIFTIDGIQYEHFLDPLNPRVFGVEDLPTDPPSSYFEGPEVAPVPYLEQRSGISKGALATFEIDSKVLKGKRTVTMYTPAISAKGSKPRAFMLVFDAESYIKVIAAPTILDNMIAEGIIPPLVVAFVHSHATRNEDLQPNMEFQAFLSTELMPWIRERYPISHDPKLNVVAGLSLGGLTAAYTTFVHPELFGNSLSESGSFWWSPHYEKETLPSPNAGWMVKQFAEAAAKPVRFYVAVGLWESPGVLSSTRILDSVLLGKGNRVSYNEVVNGHNDSNFQQALPDGLIALLGKKTGQH